ncbi:hypothetical protein [Kaistia granuli]|uniref:hypothetical protein n=1 Tax=Kaistia granuli TaxID=363259 RepID=UPI00036AFA6E|nr:hypothetical protein [Kaistia granuli]
MLLTFTRGPIGPTPMRRLPGRAALATALLFAAAPFGAQAETVDQPPAAASPSPAAEAAPRAGRYTMVPAEGGFVRLDTETGDVSHCQRGAATEGGVWRCAAIPENVLAKPAPAAAPPGGDVAELRRQVETLRARIDEIERRTEPKAQLSGDPELDRAMNFSEELMRRFFGMVRELKQDADQGRI